MGKVQDGTKGLKVKEREDKREDSVVSERGGVEKMRVLILVESVIIVVVLLLSLALMTLAERKIMGVIQRRVGPNRVGYGGILQPIGDGLKLVLKENVVPSHSNRNIYKIAPIVTLILSLLA